MRWLALSVFGSLILLFATAAGLAEEQSSAPKGNAAVPTVTEPNQRAAPADLQQQQGEQIRQQARQRIRQRIGPYDTNAPPGVRSRMGSPGGATPNNVQNQQLQQSIEQLMATEEAKHLDRLARLNRIRELAQQQGNTELAARAESYREGTTAVQRKIAANGAEKSQGPRRFA